jgi:hypothetical protein
MNKTSDCNYCKKNILQNKITIRTKMMKRLPVVFRKPWRLFLCLPGKLFRRRTRPKSLSPFHTRWRHCKKLKQKCWVRLGLLSHWIILIWWWVFKMTKLTEFEQSISVLFIHLAENNFTFTGTYFEETFR